MGLHASAAFGSSHFGAVTFGALAPLPGGRGRESSSRQIARRHSSLAPQGGHFSPSLPTRASPTILRTRKRDTRRTPLTQSGTHRRVAPSGGGAHGSRIRRSTHTEAAHSHRGRTHTRQRSLGLRSAEIRGSSRLAPHTCPPSRPVGGWRWVFPPRASVEVDLFSGTVGVGSSGFFRPGPHISLRP